jgi:pseudouridine-5'-monophosphatase
VKQGVATSSPRALYDLKVRRHHDWFALFDCVVSVEDPGVARGKPAPDVFLAAACRLGARPAECLAFEDSPAGVSAAIAAGMTVVAIPGPEVGRDSIDGAAEVLDSLEEFRPERWGLPAF